MIENWFFVFALIAVLLIPGPTNALLASSAHQKGLLNTMSLIPVEWMGYLYAIGLWALFIHLFHPIWPALGIILHIGSVLYVFWLAFHLWKSSHLQKHYQHHPHIPKRLMFMSTLKNPKSLLLAAGIFPAETWDSAENTLLVVAVFSLVLVVVAMFWMLFGRALLAGSFIGIKADHLYKGSAMLLIICMLPMIFRLF